MDILTQIVETYGLFGLAIFVIIVAVWRFSKTQNADREADIEQQRTVTKMMVNNSSRMDAMQKTMDNQYEKIIELTKELGDTKQEHAVLVTQYDADKKLNSVVIEGLKDESKRQSDKIIELTERLNSVKEQRDELKEELKAMTEERDALRVQLSEANTRIIDLTGRIEKLETQPVIVQPMDTTPASTETMKDKKEDVA